MNGGTVLKFDGLPTAYALRLKESVGLDGFPGEGWWERAPAIRFEHDWRGEHADAQRATEVRLFWTGRTLWIRIVGHYRQAHVVPEGAADGWGREILGRGGG